MPDVRSPEFAAAARRQCLLANASAAGAEAQALIDSLYAWPDDAYIP
ncbi:MULTISPECIES: antitoxin MazE family protein [unclassified Synechococcus]|nr:MULTISPECIES: antitoxin MazE family protein [unclassified Synechococcus]MCT0212436.1 antitoxin MazE family protein [Synechococcus sp. CS-1326]MCT0234619.1 antitoxin MazE family protein [Synechococcus sp. CS-1327]